MLNYNYSEGAKWLQISLLMNIEIGTDYKYTKWGLKASFFNTLKV